MIAHSPECGSNPQPHYIYTTYVLHHDKLTYFFNGKYYKKSYSIKQENLNLVDVVKVIL